MTCFDCPDAKVSALCGKKRNGGLYDCGRTGKPVLRPGDECKEERR